MSEGGGILRGHRWRSRAGPGGIVPYPRCHPGRGDAGCGPGGCGCCRHKGRATVRFCRRPPVTILAAPPCGGACTQTGGDTRAPLHSTRRCTHRLNVHFVAPVVLDTECARMAGDGSMRTGEDAASSPGGRGLVVSGTRVSSRLGLCLEFLSTAQSHVAGAQASTRTAVPRRSAQAVDDQGLPASGPARICPAAPTATDRVPLAPPRATQRASPSLPADHDRRTPSRVTTLVASSHPAVSVGPAADKPPSPSPDRAPSPSPASLATNRSGHARRRAGAPVSTGTGAAPVSLPADRRPTVTAPSFSAGTSPRAPGQRPSQTAALHVAVTTPPGRGNQVAPQAPSLPSDGRALGAEIGTAPRTSSPTPGPTSPQPKGIVSPPAPSITDVACPLLPGRGPSRTAPFLIAIELPPMPLHPGSPSAPLPAAVRSRHVARRAVRCGDGDGPSGAGYLSPHGPRTEGSAKTASIAVVGVPLAADQALPPATPSIPPVLDPPERRGAASPSSQSVFALSAPAPPTRSSTTAPPSFALMPSLLGAERLRSPSRGARPAHPAPKLPRSQEAPSMAPHCVVTPTASSPTLTTWVRDAMDIPPTPGGMLWQTARSQAAVLAGASQSAPPAGPAPADNATAMAASLGALEPRHAPEHSPTSAAASAVVKGISPARAGDVFHAAASPAPVSTPAVPERAERRTESSQDAAATSPARKRPASAAVQGPSRRMYTDFTRGAVRPASTVALQARVHNGPLRTVLPTGRAPSPDAGNSTAQLLPGDEALAPTERLVDATAVAPDLHRPARDPVSRSGYKDHVLHPVGGGDVHRVRGTTQDVDVEDTAASEQPATRAADCPEASQLPDGSQPDSIPDAHPPVYNGIMGRPPLVNERAYVNVSGAAAAPFQHPLLQWDDDCSESQLSERLSLPANAPPQPAERLPDQEPSPPCGLCPQYDSGNLSPLPMVPVRVRRSFGRRGPNILVHQECAEWSPEVYWNDDNMLVNVEAAYTRGRRFRCSICDTKGATIGCYVDSCRKVFHYRCLKVGHCKVDDTAYAVYCQAHGDVPTPALFRSVTGAWACRVPDV